MTREQLIEFANNANSNFWKGRNEKQVYSCKAVVIDWEQADFLLLKSYSTIVGLYYKPTGTMFVFDSYSATTYKHIYKACKMLDAARITWLYKRFDGVIETGLTGYTNTYKLGRKAWKQVISCDFSSYIGSMNRL